MADLYWIANGASANASVASNWATNASGSAVSSNAPQAGDNIYFGHGTTRAANKGSAPCNWNVTGTPYLTSFQIMLGYQHTTEIQSDTISTDATGNKISGPFEWSEFDFMVGQQITLSDCGDAANNITTTILAISGNTITAANSLATEAAGVSTNGIKITGLAQKVTFSQNMSCNLLSLNGTIDAGSAIVINLGNGSSTWDSGAGQRYVLNGINANILNEANITYNIDGTGNGTTKTFFDDGPHPIVQSTTATHFSPQYKQAPTSTSFGKVTFNQFKITNASAVMQPVDGNKNPRLDITKKFHITSNASGAFTYAPDLFDAGFSTWGFTATSGGFVLPVSGTTTYGQGAFVAHLYGLEILEGSSSGHKATIAEEKTLSVNSLVIEKKTILKGEEDLTNESSLILCVNKPKIHGGWNFKQVTEGIYASMPSKLTLNGSGGGGSGTVTNIATSAPITGGAITTTGTIGISAATTGAAGSMSAADKTKLDGIETNADVTDAANVTAAGALMDSELTDLAGVKGVTISTLQVKPSEGAFADGDKTKLDGIETNADVTDATNVNAAGAVMESDVDAKGDIFVATADNTVTRLAVGTNNHVLTADSSEASGVKWAAASGGGSGDVVGPSSATNNNFVAFDGTTGKLVKDSGAAASAFATAAQGAKADTAVQPAAISAFLSAGDPISALTNDAEYLDIATTPTAIFGRWELTTAVNGLAEATDNLLAVDDSTGFTRTGTLTGFSGGTFTANAATAGTYLVYARLHFGDSTTGTSIAETSGNKYTLQILMYHGSTMEGFGRIQKNGFWVDDHFDCTSIVTLADGDTLQIKHKMVDHAASSTKYRIKNGGGNPANAIIMVKLA